MYLHRIPFNRFKDYIHKSDKSINTFDTFKTVDMSKGGRKKRISLR